MIFLRRTASVGTNKKNAFDHLVHLCANLDCLEICAIEQQKEAEEVRQTTNTPSADTIIRVARTKDDPVVTSMKSDVMQPIAGRLAIDISTLNEKELENFLVMTHQKASIQSDRDMIIGCDYLMKLNVR